MDQIDKIIAYENGELSPNEVIELFAGLIKSGMAWNLQGHYGRAAHGLIEGGYIDVNGNVLEYLSEG